MAMKICKDCGAEVSSNAKACPKCGKDQRNFLKRHKVLSFILAIAVIGTLGAAIGGSDNSGTQTTSTSSVQSKAEEVMEVDYNVLFQDYQDNPINADAKYKGKILKVSGSVYDIDREIAGQPYVTFHIGDKYSFTDIRLTFKKSEESKVTTLTKGKNITVKGRCDGTLLSTSVSLVDCEIIE